MKHKVKNSEDLNNIDSSCTDDESEDGQSSISHKDQDSEVSFESDNDEEIDAAERIGLNTLKGAPTKSYERREMRRPDAGTRLTKNEMETGDENRHITD